MSQPFDPSSREVTTANGLGSLGRKDGTGDPDRYMREDKLPRKATASRRLRPYYTGDCTHRLRTPPAALLLAAPSLALLVLLLRGMKPALPLSWPAWPPYLL